MRPIVECSTAWHVPQGSIQNSGSRLRTLAGSKPLPTENLRSDQTAHDPLPSLRNRKLHPPLYYLISVVEFILFPYEPPPLPPRQCGGTAARAEGQGAGLYIGGQALGRATVRHAV